MELPDLESRAVAVGSDARDKMIRRLLSRCYNEPLESFCTRLLYFFNTIDTYYGIAGIFSYGWAMGFPPHLPLFLAGLLFVHLTCKGADFYPVFIALVFLEYLFLLAAGIFPGREMASLVGVNVVFFAVIQSLFMGIPDAIVARDPRVIPIKLFHSLFTVAPTTVSFSMSVGYASYLSLTSHLLESDRLTGGGKILVLLSFLGGALLTRAWLPRNRPSKFHKVDIGPPCCRRVILLNIDGCRLDIFDSLRLPHLARIKQQGSYHREGLATVYRALTNPAFASILTGATPEEHGIRSNNLGQGIRVEGLPDVVKTIAYGSMHVKHFCREHWETRIVSLPTTGIYRGDEVALQWLREDLVNRPEVRLFVFDFSEADFLGHAYGSTSLPYQEALRRIDARIGAFSGWLEDQQLSQDTCLIICSDHGIAGIDHSYLIAASERRVPFIVRGPRIKKNHEIATPGTIMDICPTLCYLLGVRYPRSCRGQVFTEMIEGNDPRQERKDLVSRLNRVKYDREAGRYRQDHPEIYLGTAEWWDRTLRRYTGKYASGVRVLDIGAGDGFVLGRLVENGIKVRRAVCQDLAPAMLEIIRDQYREIPGLFCVETLEEVGEEAFDLVTASAIFHHVVDPSDLTRWIDKLLLPGGHLIGAHEPNASPFQHPFYSWAASCYKRAGGRIGVDPVLLSEINDQLAKQYPGAAPVNEEELLQMVEYHSPLEQFLDAVDRKAGFPPQEFIARYFTGYAVEELDTYTTFFCRRGLGTHPVLSAMLQRLYRLWGPEGNLFRFVLRRNEVT